MKKQNGGCNSSNLPTFKEKHYLLARSPEDDNSFTAESKLWFDHTPWVLVSSIFFAVCHAGNWIGPNTEFGLSSLSSIDLCVGLLGGKDNVMVLWMIRHIPIFGCIGQMLSAFYVSLYVFSPVYQERGVLASIGSHSAWNFILRVAPVYIPMRMTLGGIKRIFYSPKNPDDAQES